MKIDLKIDAIVIPSPAAPLAALFADLETELAKEVLERPNEIHGAILALLCQCHLLFLGEPGIAKSHLINRLMARIADVLYFHTLLDTYDTPSTVLGPVDMLIMKDTGAQIPRSEGYLPTAQVANVEEIFNAVDAMLKALLMIVLERMTKVDGKLVKVPLSTMFCSTNDLPKGSALRALYDRLLLRYYTEEVQDDANLVEILLMELDPNPPAIVTWDQVVEAQAAVKTVDFSRDMAKLVARVRRELRDENIRLSTRRWAMSVPLLKAEAWMDGATEVGPEHFGVLVPMCWNTPDQIATVDAIVLEHSNPLEKKTNVLLKDLSEIRSNIQKALDNSDPHERIIIGNEAYLNVKRAKADLVSLVAKAGKSRRQLTLLTTARDLLFNSMERLQYEVFEDDEDAA